MARCVACAALLLCTAHVRAQHLVQAAVDGLVDPVVAHEAGMILELQDGVLMARFDVHTRNMMLRVDPSCGLDRSTLNALLAPLGLHARCLRRTTSMSEPFRHVDPDHCAEPLQQEK